ncbi:MAG: COX15/CtaA family protein [Pseudomonadota bacterium]
MSFIAATARPRAVAAWLYAIAGLVLAMVVIGGITRLTESGLSITEWKPVRGAIPPLGDAQWHAEFAKYRTTPEYQQVNRGMSLGEFKFIFFWEYIHRLLGRIVGLAFAAPLAWFWWRRAIPAGYLPRLLALLALGALQGAIGWWMVKSGLTERTDVSHLRLAVHLLTALITLSGLVWTALDLRRLERGVARPARLTGIAIFACALLALQIVWGAFTAGLDAGYAFASWPLMGGTLFPAEGWQQGWSLVRNAIDNPIAVQFVHRWLAFAAAGALLGLAWRANGAGARRAASALVVLVIGQMALGIATLLSGVALVVAVAHQANAALLVIAVTAAAHALGRRG